MSDETMKIADGDRSWSRYDAVVEGLSEYWYPVLNSTSLGRKLLPVEVAGMKIFLMRDGGKIYALEDKCPHREVPLSMGTREFPGHVTCVYHGWVFDLETGMLKAALPDGPESPIVGKACVRTFPVEERCGMIWVWMGKGEPVPVEEDIPEELLRADARIFAKFRIARGNWRYASENGFDEAHGKMLHRSSWWVYFKRMAGWNETEIIRTEDGVWLTRYQKSVTAQDDYPELGRWPRFNFFQRRQKQVAQGSNQHTVCIRLPCTLRVVQPGNANWTHYEWYVPIDANRYRYLQIAVAWTSGVGRLFWWLRYYAYILWVHHYGFNNQDLQVVSVQGDSHPVRAFRPDISITAWRKMVEEEARGPSGASRTAEPAQAAE